MARNTPPITGGKVMPKPVRSWNKAVNIAASGGHAGSEMLGHELCECSFQRVVAGVGAHLGEVEQGIVQLAGVAACHGQQHPAQVGLLDRVEPPDRAEVDQREPLVAEHEYVAWVRVGVEGPVDHDLA